MRKMWSFLLAALALTGCAAAPADALPAAETAEMTATETEETAAPPVGFTVGNLSEVPNTCGGYWGWNTNFAGLFRGGRFQIVQCQQLDGPLYQLGIGFGQHAMIQIEVVFQTDTQMPAHGDGGHHDGQMAGGNAAARPGGAFRQQIFQICQIFNGAGHAAGAAQHDLVMAGLSIFLGL